MNESSDVRLFQLNQMFQIQNPQRENSVTHNYSKKIKLFPNENPCSLTKKHTLRVCA